MKRIDVFLIIAFTTYASVVVVIGTVLTHFIIKWW